MRVEEFLEEFKEEQSERLQDSKQKIFINFEKEKEKHCKEFLNVMEELFLRCKTMQEKGEKNNIRYICFFCLRQSVLTESYEYQISLYDHTFYADRADLESFWEPKYYRSVIQQDAAYFAELLRKKKLRVLDHEVKEFERAYTFQLFQELPREVVESIPYITELDAYKEIKSKDCGFYFGEFREKIEQIG